VRVCVCVGGAYEGYITLCFHFSEEFFLKHLEEIKYFSA